MWPGGAGSVLVQDEPGPCVELSWTLWEPTVLRGSSGAISTLAVESRGMWSCGHQLSRGAACGFHLVSSLGHQALGTLLWRPCGYHPWASSFSLWKFILLGKLCQGQVALQGCEECEEVTASQLVWGCTCPSLSLIFLPGDLLQCV